MFKCLLLNLLIYVFVDAAFGENIEDFVQRYKRIWDDNLKDALAWERPTYSRNFDYGNISCEPLEDTYDFVIIGGGSSGAVLASRLSENPKWSILLLEAGGEETDFSQIPAGYLTVLSTDFNWGYLSTPQKNACLAMVNNQCTFARGKVLGGETAVNDIAYVRGNKMDFDLLEEMGNPGWNFDHILPYFKKMENYSIEADADYHGYSGPLDVTYPEPLTPLLQKVIDASNENGYPILDFNGKRQVGVSRFQVNTRNGRRWSINQAYLQQVKHRNNLKIKTNSLVTKIKFNENVAVSVDYLRDSKCFTVKARKEIILAAGAINSPQLLMLSGIGVREDLEKLQIPVIADLKVGHNLVEHIGYFGLSFDTDINVTQLTLEDDFRYYFQGKGRLAAPIPEVVTYRQRNHLGDFPDIEIMHSVSKNFQNPIIVKNRNNFKDEIFWEMSPSKPSNIFSHILLLHPKSRGKVTLKSSNPLDYPVINPNFLEDDEDIEMLYWGIKQTLNLLETNALQSINARLGDNSIPPCKDLKGKEFWYCLIRHLATGSFHPAGTCKMGKDPKDSVVNRELLLHGFKNLRVVDASVIPVSSSGHNNPAATVIAEKIADVIKAKYYFC